MTELVATAPDPKPQYREVFSTAPSAGPAEADESTGPSSQIERPIRVVSMTEIHIHPEDLKVLLFKQYLGTVATRELMQIPGFDEAMSEAKADTSPGTSWRNIRRS